MKIDWKKEIRMPRLSLSWLRSLFLRLREMLNRGPSIGRPSVKAPSIRGKGPSIKGPSLARPKALSKGPQIQMPRAVTDLYGDLRERHLLPVVALLIAAIVAAPILLGDKSEDKEPTAVAPIAGEEAATGDSSFTVVPAARHLRSPSKRLGHRQALDPFRIDEKAAEANSSEPSKTSGSGSEASSTGGNEAASTGSSSGGGTTTSTTETTVVESSPSTPEQTTAPGNVTVQVDVTGYTAVIKAGDTTEPAEELEVVPMAKLPTKKEPLVVFTGLTPDDKRALLLMTSKVTGYYGDGHCTVDKQACQMLELQQGKSATFSYISGGEEKRYKVTLEKIEPVLSKAEVSSTESVEKKGDQKPAERGNALAQARSFSK
jgi:hypothetical protein